MGYDGVHPRSELNARPVDTIIYWSAPPTMLEDRMNPIEQYESGMVEDDNWADASKTMGEIIGGD